MPPAATRLVAENGRCGSNGGFQLHRPFSRWAVGGVGSVGRRADGGGVTGAHGSLTYPAEVPDTSGTGRTPRRKQPSDARSQGRPKPRSGEGPTGGGSGAGAGRTASGRTPSGRAPSQRPASRRTAPRGASPQGSSRSAATFRRRRVIVVVLAVLLLAGLALGVWALVAALTGNDDGGATATPSAGATPSTTAPAETTEPAEPETTEPAIGSTPPQPTACTAEEATLAVDAPSSARVGAGVTFSLDVATTTDVPCLIDLGSDATTIEIRSGDDVVWSSAQCAYTPSERRLLLGEGATDTQAVTWAGSRSAPGCTGGQPLAEAGTYRIVATHAQDGAVVTGEATVVLQ